MTKKKIKVNLKPLKKMGDTTIRRAEPIKNTFAIPVPTIGNQVNSAPVAKPVLQEPVKEVYQAKAIPKPKAIPIPKPTMTQTHPKGKIVLKSKQPKIKLKIDLTQLVANGFIQNISLIGDKGNYTATVILDGNDMYISGEGVSVQQAIEKLNQKVLDLNFEF